MKKLGLVFVLVVLILQSAFSQEPAPRHEASFQRADTISHLSPAEKQILSYLREQEWMSADVYNFFLALFPLPVFQNIGMNGLNHSEMVHLLMMRNNLPDPACPHIPGRYTDSTITSHYNKLIDIGRASQDKALLACLSLEEFDLQHVMLFQLKVSNPDVLNLLEIVARGARNHMRALYRHCRERGLKFEPSYLSKEYFNTVANQPPERGRFQDREERP